MTKSERRAQAYPRCDSCRNAGGDDGSVYIYRADGHWVCSEKCRAALAIKAAK